MCSFLCNGRTISMVMSLFPLRYSLIPEELVPRISASSFCFNFVSNVLSSMSSLNEGVPMEQFSTSYFSTIFESSTSSFMFGWSAGVLSLTMVNSSCCYYILFFLNVFHHYNLSMFSLFQQNLSIQPFSGLN
jgi:hypothetical protein